MSKENKYINILTIKILGISFEFSIGNPLYFINEFRKEVEDEQYR